MTSTEGLKRRVLRDDVVEHIVDSILSGVLKPGDKIVETRISRELHVSQGAVREAIRDLTARGFVDTEPYKGSKVRILSAADMQEYFDVRCELEPLAISWALVKGAVDVDVLKGLVADMESAARERDMNMLRRADITFHRKIVEFSGNTSLMRSWDALANDYWIYTLTKKEFEMDFDLLEHAGRHNQIIEAIESKDIELMKVRLKEHFIY